MHLQRRGVAFALLRVPDAGWCRLRKCCALRTHGCFRARRPLHGPAEYSYCMQRTRPRSAGRRRARLQLQLQRCVRPGHWGQTARVISTLSLRWKPRRRDDDRGSRGSEGQLVDLEGKEAVSCEIYVLGVGAVVAATRL